MDRLYTVKEATEILKISRAKLYNLIEKGSLKHVKLDGRTLFKESELSRFIDGLQQTELAK